MNQADHGRMQALFKACAEEAIDKIFSRLRFPEMNLREREYWIEVIEDRTKRAFQDAVAENLDTITKAMESKIHIRDAKITAKGIIKLAEERAEAIRKQAEKDGKKLIREMRDQEARNLKEVRRKIGTLRSTTCHLERRLGAMGPLLEARKALADQLVRGRRRLSLLSRGYVDAAIENDLLPSKGELTLSRKLIAEQLMQSRHRLAVLRNACVKKESELLRQHHGVLPIRILSDFYPNPPWPECAPSETGLGIPQVPGIYFLWKNGVVEYVGLSTNLNGRVRLKTHHILRPDHEISFVRIEKRDLTWAECWYIGSLRPQLNYGKQAYHYMEESDPRLSAVAA